MFIINKFHSFIINKFHNFLPSRSLQFGEGTNTERNLQENGVAEADWRLGRAGDRELMLGGGLGVC